MHATCVSPCTSAHPCSRPCSLASPTSTCVSDPEGGLLTRGSAVKTVPCSFRHPAYARSLAAGTDDCTITWASPSQLQSDKDQGHLLPARAPLHQEESMHRTGVQVPRLTPLSGGPQCEAGAGVLGKTWESAPILMATRWRWHRFLLYSKQLLGPAAGPVPPASLCGLATL